MKCVLHDMTLIAKNFVPSSHAACWALASAMLSIVCMAQYIYLYVIKEKKRRAPSAVVLTIFGMIGALCLGLGGGGFVAYLGLAITDTLHHIGELVAYYTRGSVGIQWQPPM